MVLLPFRKKEVLAEIQKSFPKADIVKYGKFGTGLVSDVYQVEIINPKKVLSVKIYHSKRKEDINKNNKILEYLFQHKIPAPHIFSNKIIDSYGIVVMTCTEGKTISQFFQKLSKEKKNRILRNTSAILKKIHKLKQPKFWIHKRHEVKNKKEWIAWTNLRIKKYLEFSKKDLKRTYQTYLKIELKKLKNLLMKNQNFKFVPLHWDYHFSNISATEDGIITGVFDFDNAMKGHNLSDLGQTLYWLILHFKKKPDFQYFLKGYSEKISELDKQFIFGYFLLHTIAVMRTNWYKKRLNWLMKEHKKILDNCISGKYKI